MLVLLSKLVMGVPNLVLFFVVKFLYLSMCLVCYQVAFIRVSLASSSSWHQPRVLSGCYIDASAWSPGLMWCYHRTSCNPILTTSHISISLSQEGTLASVSFTNGLLVAQVIHTHTWLHSSDLGFIFWDYSSEERGVTVVRMRIWPD